MGSLVAELAEKLSAATNSLDFDEQTMFLNTSANTVGIGTNAPASKLDVRGTMQVGVDDTGYDVKFFGDTSGKYMLWDQSGDELAFVGATKISFFDAAGGESSSARHRSVVASVEDTLIALDYLLSRADELNIDTDRIVLKGESAGAFIALNVAYCADKFEISGPTIAAVIDFSGGIAETFCGGGTAIDPGEAAVFIAHGTDDTVVSYDIRALSIVDGAAAAGITYELYPLEGVGHEWLLGMLGQTTADGRKIDDLLYEFLNRVLY